MPFVGFCHHLAKDPPYEAQNWENITDIFPLSLKAKKWPFMLGTKYNITVSAHTELCGLWPQKWIFMELYETIYNNPEVFWKLRGPSIRSYI